VKRLMALSLGVQRAQLEQRTGLVCPRPCLLRPWFLFVSIHGHNYGGGLPSLDSHNWMFAALWFQTRRGWDCSLSPKHWKFSPRISFLWRAKLCPDPRDTASIGSCCPEKLLAMPVGHVDVMLQLIRDYQSLNSPIVESFDQSPTSLEFSRILRSNRPVVFRS